MVLKDTILSCYMHTQHFWAHHCFLQYVRELAVHSKRECTLDSSLIGLLKPIVSTGSNLDTIWIELDLLLSDVLKEEKCLWPLKLLINDRGRLIIGILYIIMAYIIRDAQVDHTLFTEVMVHVPIIFNSITYCPPHLIIAWTHSPDA